MKDKSHKKRSEISPPEHFTHVTHIDRSDTVNDLVHALQTPVRPLDGAPWPETLPLPRKATAPSAYASGAHTLGRNAHTPTFSSSTSNLHSGTVSSAGYGTWTGAGVKGKIKRSNLLTSTDFLVPKGRAPDVPSPSLSTASNGGLFLTAPRHYRSVSASNDDVSLHTMGYVNVKPFAQPYHDPHAQYTHAENDGYLSPYTVLKPAPPPHRPSSSASPKGRASTVHAHMEIEVVKIRPPREVAPPPPRDSRHETDANTHIAAPDRITITLARPTDLFGPGPGLGLGLGGLGSIGIGIDDVVPLPCPGSLDSGVSEPPFPAPAPPPSEESAPEEASFSPEDLKDYIGKIQKLYNHMRENDQLDSEGIIQRLNVLKPAEEIILADMAKLDSISKKIRPAPGPPGDAPSGASTTPIADDAVTPTGRPVPKPRTTKPSSPATPTGDGSSSASSGIGSGSSAPDHSPLPPVSALAARFNALPEAAVQLDPSTLKLAPEQSQLAKVLPPESEDDEEVTRL